MNATKQVLRSSTMPLVALLLCSLPVRAGQSQWTTHGPQGGSVLALAVDPLSPSRVFAGTPAGVFRSLDRGNSWEPFGEGPPGRADRLLIDSSQPPTLYAIAGRKAFRSPVTAPEWSIRRTQPFS